MINIMNYILQTCYSCCIGRTIERNSIRNAINEHTGRPRPGTLLVQEINRELNFSLLQTCNNVWIKCVLFGLVNFINKFQEIAEGSKKTSACFKQGNYKKVFFT